MQGDLIGDHVEQIVEERIEDAPPALQEFVEEHAALTVAETQTVRISFQYDQNCVRGAETEPWNGSDPLSWIVKLYIDGRRERVRHVKGDDYMHKAFHKLRARTDQHGGKTA